jgi:hypothetical protein
MDMSAGTVRMAVIAMPMAVTCVVMRVVMIVM